MKRFLYIGLLLWTTSFVHACVDVPKALQPILDQNQRCYGPNCFYAAFKYFYELPERYVGGTEFLYRQVRDFQYVLKISLVNHRIPLQLEQYLAPKDVFVFNDGDHAALYLGKSKQKGLMVFDKRRQEPRYAYRVIPMHETHLGILPRPEVFMSESMQSGLRPSHFEGVDVYRVHNIEKSLVEGQHLSGNQKIDMVLADVLGRKLFKIILAQENSPSLFGKGLIDTANRLSIKLKKRFFMPLQHGREGVLQVEEKLGTLNIENQLQFLSLWENYSDYFYWKYFELIVIRHQLPSSDLYVKSSVGQLDMPPTLHPDPKNDLTRYVAGVIWDHLDTNIPKKQGVELMMSEMMRRFEQFGHMQVARIPFDLYDLKEETPLDLVDIAHFVLKNR